VGPPCNHFRLELTWISCKDCITSFLATCAERGEECRCPTCSQGPIKVMCILSSSRCLFMAFQEADLLEVLRSKVNSEMSSRQPTSGITLRRNDFRSSTKLMHSSRVLVRLYFYTCEQRYNTCHCCLVGQLRDQNPCFRAVVFSQFTSFLDLIEIALQRECFKFYRYDGSMDIKKRNAAISEFSSSSRHSKILIVSLKAGGVGLNVRSTLVSV
jgi:DNA repair protein RAD5